MWRVPRVAYFSFKDPAYIPNLLKEVRHTGAALDVYIQSPSFDYENYSGILLSKIHACRNGPKREPQTYTNMSLDKVLQDARFHRFMDGFIQAKISPEKYVETLYILSFIHKDLEQISTFNPQLRKTFVHFLSENTDKLSLNDLSRCISILSLAFPKLEAVPQVHKLLNSVKKLLELENPPPESLPRIVLSLGNL